MYERTNERIIKADNALILSLLPNRTRDSHKGTYGKTAIVGGCADYTGAPFISALASLRSGVGYSTLFIPQNLLPYYYLKAPELLLKGLNGGDRYEFDEKNASELLAYDSIAYGMGMGCTREVYLGVKFLLERYEGKLIIDADGLNSLAKFGSEVKDLFKAKKSSVLCTPHKKEFSRLSGLSLEEISRSPVAHAETLAREWEISLLLKGATTVVTDGKQTYLSESGNSGQAKAGSGDALSGLTAGLCAQGVLPLQAGVVASYLLGKSAQRLVKEESEYTVLPTDCINGLGKVLNELSSENTGEGGGEE